MPVNVVALIRQRKERRAAGIEELAGRLAAGVDVPPEEIETLLDATGCDEEMLQARIDTLEKRSQLKAAIERGEKAERRLEKIDADVSATWEKVAAAHKAHEALVTKYEPERIELSAVVTAANRAREELVSPAVLTSADRQRLAEARQAATAAASAVGETRQAIPAAKESLEAAETVLANATEQAKQHRGDPGAADFVARAKNAVAARGARLRELEAGLPKLLQEADRLARVVSTLEDELRSV